MPILTEQEIQDLKNKENEYQAKLEEKDQELVQVYRGKRKLKSEKRGLVISTAIFGLLFLAMVFTVMFKPKLFGLNEEGVRIAENEVVVKKSTLDDYEAKISDLETKASQVETPLKLEEYYAVQLGAIKKSDKNLPADDFNFLNKAEYKGFDLYTLGVFKTKEEAQELEKVLNLLEFENVFVGLYKDNERVKAFY